MSAWSLEYTIDVDEENAVVRSKIYGLWTAEIAERYLQDYAEEVKPIIGKPWAKIVDLSNWKTSWEKVIDIIGGHMAWSKKNQVKMQLYVLNNPSTFRQLNRMFDKGAAKDISHTFRSMEEAEKFLKENWIDKEK